MSETLYVTPAQVLAAKLAVELSEEEGKEPGEALRAIANATVVSEEDALGEAADYTANLTQEATDAAKLILDHAQQLADSLIDEAMASARALLLEARTQQRAIIEQAKVTAQGTINHATAIAERAGSEGPSVHDIESIRTFAKLVQAQSQVVLDALNEQGRQLDAEPLRSDRGSKIAS